MLTGADGVLETTLDGVCALGSFAFGLDSLLAGAAAL